MRVSGLVHALQALEPYLGDVVICGGWAWYLYRKYLGNSAGIPAEFTRDLDCAVREGMPVRGVPLRQRLNESAFECEYRGESLRPALLFSWPSSRRPQVEIEFITQAR